MNNNLNWLNWFSNSNNINNRNTEPEQKEKNKKTSQKLKWNLVSKKDKEGIQNIRNFLKLEMFEDVLIESKDFLKNIKTFLKKVEDDIENFETFREKYKSYKKDLKFHIRLKTYIVKTLREMKTEIEDYHTNNSDDDTIVKFTMINANISEINTDTYNIIRIMIRIEKRLKR